VSHFHSTQVGIGICGKCRVPVLEGWGDGHHVRAELQPVVVSGEIAAIRAGLATYLLRRGRLEYRSDSQIASERKAEPLLIEHKCGNEIPAKHRDMSTKPITAVPYMEGIPY
jgi:hypothetical protein